MKTIAVYNNKGGVSKTTTVINVAYILAEVKKLKVLVIDCDGQQNTSRFFSDTLTVPAFEQCFRSDSSFPNDALLHTRYENIDVLISSKEMNRIAEEFAVVEENEKTRLIQNIQKVYENKYDYVLFDMPPALNGITEALLSLTDGVVVPVELGTFSIQGISKVTDTINQVGAKFVGCFISKYDKANKMDESLKELLIETLGNKVFDTVIPYSNIIRNSINYRVTAYEYQHWQIPTKKYIELTEEIIRKVG